MRNIHRLEEGFKEVRKEEGLITNKSWNRDLSKQNIGKSYCKKDI